MPTASEPDEIYAPDRATWRAWLAENHSTSPGAWLILHKKASSEPCVSYDESVEEALCFGWIDSKTLTLDSLTIPDDFDAASRARSNWQRKISA